MKIIDLLNKIANNEEVPKTICYCDRVLKWTGLNYYCKETDEFLDKFICLEDLEYEVKIIDEHKIPEKISEYADINTDTITKWSSNEEKLKNKINEIIDYLEKNNE